MQTSRSPWLDRLFRLANLAIIPGWLLMIGAPRSRLTQRVINDDRFFIGMGGLYAAMLGGALVENEGNGFSFNSMLNPTLDSIGKLFQEGGPKGTFAGWTHYLVFDFFVGRAILRDAQEKQIPHWLVVPALLCTLMSGPLGLAYYQVLLRLRGAA